MNSGDHPDLPSSYGAEVRRVRDVLGRLVQESAVSLREVERRVGLSTSTLSKVLNGLLRLNFVHVLVLVDGLGIDRAELFAYLYPRQQAPPEPVLEELREQLTAARDRPAPLPPGSRTRQELESLIRAAVEEVFRREAPTLLRAALEEQRTLAD